ncbi:rhodopsin [Patella vulgata]|uniref:rhodopsin n=1 Tax=Patella vulgata TaxID=6465 RepID=UPI0021804608|nr:rhodopsin [Patella vulgata]
MASTAMQAATTAASTQNVTHLYDTYTDMFVHPHWKQFPPIAPAWHNFIGIFITFVGISGCLGNFVVIYTFSKTKSLRTASNMFVVNLALSDLTFSAVNGFPLFSLSAFNHRWIFGKVACELYGLTGGIFGLMSINTMAVISIDRYFVITRPFSAMRNMTHKRAFLMIVFVWIWSILWAIPPIFGWGAYIPEGFQTSCTFDYLTRTDSQRSFIMSMYLCGFVLPLAIIVFCYIFIIRSVMNHEKEMHKLADKLDAKDARGDKEKARAEIKIAKVSMTIIILYLLSWTPYAIVALIAQWGPASWVTPFVSEIPVLFAKASAMHNPIVYALSHPKFRDAVSRLMPWFLCCCALSEKEKKLRDEANRNKLSRMTSQTSNIYSDGSSVMSNLSDTTCPNNGGIEMGPSGRQGSRRMRDVQETSMGVDNNGDLIRDILQAFVGVVQGRNNQPAAPPQVPMYVQYPYGLPAELIGPDGHPRQDVYSISQGAIPSGIDPRVLQQLGIPTGITLSKDQIYLPKDENDMPPPPERSPQRSPNRESTPIPGQVPTNTPAAVLETQQTTDVGHDNKTFEHEL